MKFSKVIKGVGKATINRKRVGIKAYGVPSIIVIDEKAERKLNAYSHSKSVSGYAGTMKSFSGHRAKAMLDGEQVVGEIISHRKANYGIPFK